MNQHITINVHPLEIPQVWHRQHAIEGYARQYVDHSHVHETLNEFCDRVCGDLKDPAAKVEVKREIRRLRRNI
jgi:hypothetical protein